MGVVSLADIEARLATVRERGGALSEFESLQDIVTALTLRRHVPSTNLDWAGLYALYIRRLYAIDKELTRLTNLPPLVYRSKSRGAMMVAISRIHAILNTLPETTEVLQAAAEQ